MTSWVSCLGLALISAALLIAPGMLALLPLRMPRGPLLALAPVVTVALDGLMGILDRLLRIPYAWWHGFAVAAAVGLILRLLRRRRTPIPPVQVPPHPRIPVRAFLAVPASWLAAAAIFLYVSFSATSPTLGFPQTPDNLFHLNSALFIIDTGNASSLELRTLIQTDRALGLYPAGWAILVAETAVVGHASVTVATTASWIALILVCWAPGIAWFAAELTRLRYPESTTAARLAALIAMPLSMCFGAFPYGAIPWGSLYPTAMATALSPAGVAFILAHRRRRLAHQATRNPPPRLAATAIVGCWIAALCFGHPRVAIATIGIVLVPYMLELLVHAFAERWKEGGVVRRRTVIVTALSLLTTIALALLGGLTLLKYLGVDTRPISDRLNGPQGIADQTWAASLYQMLAQAPLVAGTTTQANIALAALVLAGLIVALRTRGLRWLLISGLAACLLYGLAASSNSDLAKLATGLWYKDRYRLAIAGVMIAIVLAALALVTASHALARLIRKLRTTPSPASIGSWITAGTAGALSTTLIVISVTVLSQGGVREKSAAAYAASSSTKQVEYLSLQQRDFLTTLGSYVPAGELIIGDPWDGSAFSWVYADRQPLFPHMYGKWDEDRSLIAMHLDEIDTNPDICDAVNRLHARYVLYNPVFLQGGDPMVGDQFAAVHRAVEQGLFRLVAQSGDTSLYAIDQCSSTTETTTETAIASTSDDPSTSASGTSLISP